MYSLMKLLGLLSVLLLLLVHRLLALPSGTLCEDGSRIADQLNFVNFTVEQARYESMNIASPQFSFYQCAFRLCDRERSMTGYTIEVKLNDVRKSKQLSDTWARFMEDPYVEATVVNYDTVAPTCRDVLIRVNTILEESILSVDLYISFYNAPNNEGPTKRTCPCVFAPPPTTSDPLLTTDDPLPTTDDPLPTTPTPDTTTPSVTPTASAGALYNSTGSAFGLTTTAIVTIVMTGVLIGSLHICLL